MEQFDLTTPVTTPALATYTVERLTLDWPGAAISIQLRGQNGEPFSFSYSGSVATTLMRALNKADLSVKSLQRRILERLVADGALAGTISGTPD
jgi:hypothetical protein